MQEDMQREALKDDEERRKRSEQMRKERAAVCFPFVVHSIAIVGFEVPYCILIEYFKNN